jgi:NACHT domain
MLAASVAVLVWLIWFLRSGDLDRADKIASVAGMFIGLAGLVVSAWSLRVAILELRQPPGVSGDDAVRLDRAADALATAVSAQWEAEVGLRALRRPEPLRLRWSTSVRPIGDSPAVVAGTAIVGRVVQLRLHGDLDEVAEKFLALPHRRLVVLGEPGAGKTVLAMLLTLSLLERRQRQPDHAVPVLLSLSSWDPTAEHLHAWITRRLGEDYPALASPTYGAAAPQQLVTTGRILPVLDGLDELPEPLGATVIRELDRARADRPLVVTCRSQEYQQAVTAGGGVLAAAAVIELEPVTAAEAAAFLRAAAPMPARWDQMAAHLHAHPDGELAAALSTPLMVALARTIYITPGRDPSELVDLARAGGQAAVERHLLDGFIPAAYANPPPAPDTPAPRLRRPPNPDLACRWLTLLAVHLRQHHTRDLAWWQLHRLVPRRRMGPVVGNAVPTRVNTQVQGRLRGLLGEFVARFVVTLVVGLVGGLVLVLLASLAGVLQFRLVTWLAAGLVVGLTGGLTGLMDWLKSPLDATLAVTPQSVLRSDRSTAVVWLVVGLVSGLVLGLISWLVVGLVSGLVLGLVSGLVVGLVLGLESTAWGQFTILRVSLAVRGRLPLRLMAFFDDAHHRGVLRQAGAVYQFRHARLQDHLADTGSTSRPHS